MFQRAHADDESAGDGASEDADPDVVTVVEVADHAPAAEGLQVSVANTTARSIIFANESATGPVTVSEFSDPPGGLTRPAGELLAVVEVTVPEAVRNESATIELAVNATTVTAPERLAVRHYDPEAGRWHPLETTLIDSDGATVDIEAETPGFSLFAVVEASESTPTATPTPMATDTPEAAAITPTTPTESPDEQSGFGIVVAVFGLFATALVVSRRLHR